MWPTAHSTHRCSENCSGHSLCWSLACTYMVLADEQAHHTSRVVISLLNVSAIRLWRGCAMEITFSIVNDAGRWLRLRESLPEQIDLEAD